MQFTGLTQRNLEKIHLQEDKIRGMKYVPHNTEIGEAKKELEAIYEGNGRINPRYAKETLIAYKYCKTVYNYSTGHSMLDDIKEDKDIDFNDYDSE